MKYVILEKLKKLGKDNSGNFAIISALCVVPMLIGVGVAIDLNNLQRAKSELRDAAESAAVASVRSTPNSDDKRKNVAKLYIKENFQHSAFKARQPDVKVDLTPIRSTVTAHTVMSTQLMALVGKKELSVTTKVAAEMIFEPACVLVNAPNRGPSIRLQGHPTITTENCYIHNNSNSENSSLARGNPELLGADFCLNGGYEGRKWTPAPELGCAALEDPYKSLLEPDIPECEDKVKFGKSDTPISIEPGNYCGGLSIPANANVVFEPGIYVISDGSFSLGPNASISGEGVMLYLKGERSNFDLHSGGTWNVTPPDSGHYRGVAIFQERGINPRSPNQITGGGEINMSGIIYTKNAELKLHGSPVLNITGGGTMIVSDALTMQGSPELNIRSTTDMSLMPNDELIGRYAQIRVVL